MDRVFVGLNTIRNSISWRHVFPRNRLLRWDLDGYPVEGDWQVPHEALRWSLPAKPFRERIQEALVDQIPSFNCHCTLDLSSESCIQILTSPCVKLTGSLEITAEKETSVRRMFTGFSCNISVATGHNSATAVNKGRLPRGKIGEISVFIKTGSELLHMLSTETACTYHLEVIPQCG